MLKSMTGYGDATLEGKSFLISVEVKSVNNRFLKIVSKIPDEVSYIQNEMEDLIRKAILRGSIFLTVRFEPTRYVDMYEIDEEVLKKYLTTLNKIKEDLHTDERILIKDLLLLPGVIHTEEALILGKEEVLPIALEALGRAIAQLLKMRADEGARMEDEFRRRSQSLFALVDDVKKHAPEALGEYHQKLEERVNMLLSQKGVALSAVDLLKEVAILAERSDITEEVTRMDSHLRQFVSSLDVPQAVGRKLEFLVQEMVRESNTMGAKSYGSELNKSIMEMKTEVDRLKEQVMNVE